MLTLFSKKVSVISITVILSILILGIPPDMNFINIKAYLSDVIAQEFLKSITNSSNATIPISDGSSGNGTKEEDWTKSVRASGHFANNQMKDGIVTWIQGGFWNLEIYHFNKNIENSDANAVFNANFTMIRPDGSLLHNHLVNNFVSDGVIFSGNDIVVTGVADIYSDSGTEYSQVPITIHLMGKKVLGLMIDVEKTKGHFSGSNEMFGTLISGIGLDNSTGNDNIIINDTESHNTNISPIEN